MIVTKTLNVLNERKNTIVPIYLLGNRVVMGTRTVTTLSNTEVPQFIQLMKRCKDVNFKSSWIDCIKDDIESVLFELNRTHYYQYEDRGWTFRETEDEYIIDVFLDNYDMEEFVVFKVPKSEISKEELLKYADEE
jgi:hypothetical protein